MQWPCTELDHPGTPYLHAPRPALASGRGRFFPVEFQPPIEEPDSEYPFVLTTGRTLYHYNSANMTMREPGVTDKQEAPFFEIHAEDAGALGIADGAGRAARLAPRRARGAKRTTPSASIPGLVWMALHFAEQKVNWLTHDVGDPLIGTPEYKVSAVRVEPRRERRRGRLLTLGASALPRRFGEPYLYEPECESTQLLVDSRCRRAPSSSPTTRPADAGGSAAAGRHPPGRALLFSVLLKPPPERHAPELSLVAGVAVADALERHTGLSVQIKWPNDVMLSRRKVAGMPRRVARRRGRPRNRHEREPDDGGAPAERRARCGRSPGAAGTASELLATAARRPRQPLRGLARRRPRRRLRRARPARLPARTAGHRERHERHRDQIDRDGRLEIRGTARRRRERRGRHAADRDGRSDIPGSGHPRSKTPRSCRRRRAEVGASERQPEDDERSAAFVTEPRRAR